jgi:hypothetical protein
MKPDNSLNKPDPMAEELLKLPLGKNKPLCWDMDVLVAFINAYTTNKIIEELEQALSNYERTDFESGGSDLHQHYLRNRIAELKALNHRKENK